MPKKLTDDAIQALLYACYRIVKYYMEKTISKKVTVKIRHVLTCAYGMCREANFNIRKIEAMEINRSKIKGWCSNPPPVKLLNAQMYKQIVNYVGRRISKDFKVKITIEVREGKRKVPRITFPKPTTK